MRKGRDLEILKELTDSEGKYIRQRCLETYLRNHGMYNYLINRYDNNTTDEMAEILYRFINDIEVPPTCPMCGKTITFSMHGRRYANWCCQKCRNNDPVVQAKNAAGVSKARLAEYADPERRAAVTAKKIATIKARTGEDNNGSPFSTKAGQERSRQTIKERYGVDNVFQLEENREKNRQTCKQKAVEHWASLGYEIFHPDNEHVTIKNGCPIHGDVTLTLREFNNRMKENRRDNVPVCPICHPIAIHSGMELAIKSILAEIDPALAYTTNDRNVIKPLELDFVFSDYPLAIEVNGVYYHNELNKPNDYHVNKSNLCVINNISLMHIWEHDIERRRVLVKDLIRRQLNAPAINVYNLSDLKFSPVDLTEAQSFFDTNYIYGFDGRTTAAYKLSYIGQTIAMLAFGKPKNESHTIEMLGAAIIPNAEIDGGWLKVLLEISKVELKKDGYKIIRTYVCRDYYKQEWFETAGMKFNRLIDGTYTWIDFNGNVLKEDCYPMYYSEFVNELVVEKLQDNDYYRCYNSGVMKFSMNI